MEGKCYDGVVEMEGSSGSGMLLRLFYGVYGTFHEDSGTEFSHTYSTSLLVCIYTENLLGV
jgi:hypothetical protein